MQIPIKSIDTSGRIRKDFGNVSALAEDIKQNGLINPPVVTPMENGRCKLIAGERRLRALSLLGFSETEVRVMPIKDAEHQLELEISENEARKDWTMEERLEVARRRERIAAIKAKENQGARNDICQNSDKCVRVDSLAEASATIGVSKDTYNRMKNIEDNKHLLSEKDYSDWNENRMSTNAAYTKVVSARMPKQRDLVAEAEERHKDFSERKKESVVSLSDIKQDKDDLSLLAIDFLHEAYRAANQFEKMVFFRERNFNELVSALSPNGKETFKRSLERCSGIINQFLDVVGEGGEHGKR